MPLYTCAECGLQVSYDGDVTDPSQIKVCACEAALTVEMSATLIPVAKPDEVEVWLDSSM